MLCSENLAFGFFRALARNKVLREARFFFELARNKVLREAQVLIIARTGGLLSSIPL